MTDTITALTGDLDEQDVDEQDVDEQDAAGQGAAGQGTAARDSAARHVSAQSKAWPSGQGLESDGRTPVRRSEPAGARLRLAGRRARLVRQVRAEPDAGMATAEYAIATVAAAGFAGLLLIILRSDEVRGLLLGIIRGALAL